MDLAGYRKRKKHKQEGQPRQPWFPFLPSSCTTISCTIDDCSCLIHQLTDSQQQAPTRKKAEEEEEKRAVISMDKVFGPGTVLRKKLEGSGVIMLPQEEENTATVVEDGVYEVCKFIGGTTVSCRPDLRQFEPLELPTTEGDVLFADADESRADFIARAEKTAANYVSGKTMRAAGGGGGEAEHHPAKPGGEERGFVKLTLNGADINVPVSLRIGHTGLVLMVDPFLMFGPRALVFERVEETSWLILPDSGGGTATEGYVPLVPGREYIVVRYPLASAVTGGRPAPIWEEPPKEGAGASGSKPIAQLLMNIKFNGKRK